MKSFELKPTEENLLSAYKNDQIGRNTDIHAFVDILNSLEDSCSIALDGAWGSGKTFFVKQAKMILESCSPIESKSEYRDEVKTVWKNYHDGKEPEFQAQLCVYYDAWENDNDGDPILSLVYSILQQVDEETPFPKDNKIFEKVAALADCITGKSTAAVLESMKSDSVLDDLRKSKSIHSTIVEFLGHLLDERANRLIVIVDELDRCKPDYAVQLLEKIKHYFDNERVTFVFAVNLQELQHTISNYYGNAFDSCRYLDRFFDLRISLPPANMYRYYQSINFQSDYYTVDVVYYRDDIAFYLSTLQTRPNQRYFIECPDGELVVPPGETIPGIKKDGEKVLPHDGDGVWRWEQKQYLAKKDLLSFKQTKTSPLLNQNGERAKWNIYTKSYLNDKKEKGSIPRDFLESFLNRNGSEELKKLDIPFSFPKPSSLIKYLIKILNADKDIIVMDFFSGSATTAHAVIRLNAEDGGNRKFIMVQLPEKTDEKSEAYKAGYKNICEIGKERIRRAGKKIMEEAGLTAPADLDIGFRCLRLDDSNMKPVYYTPEEVSQQDMFSLVDNVKEDRTPEDLLFQVMLDLGVLLSSPIEATEIAGKKVFNVADGFLLACFDHDVTEETVKAIAQIKPYYAVFRDSSMANDSVATNFDQIFETYSPETVRKVL